MTVSELRQSPEVSEPSAGNGGQSERTCVAIVGAGISGLSLAVALKRAGISFVLLEKSSRAGGVIGSVSENGFVFERGPNTILARSEAVDELIEAVGLSDAALRAPVRGQTRHIWHGGRLHEVPTGPGALLSSRLFTLGAKFSLLRELFVRPVREDESLESMIRRRLGDEIYERVFVPMVQGIWAGDPAAMSAEATFPPLKAAERDHGSIIRGMMKTMKAAAQARRASARPDGPHMVSFVRGLQQLPEAMTQFVSQDIRSHASVDQIEKHGEKFEIKFTSPEGERRLEAESVVICAEAWSAAPMIKAIAAEAASSIANVHYAPLIAVGLGVKASSLKLPAGFGFLVSRDQGVRVLGCIFNSNFLPGRAPEGSATLTVMIGGDLDPEAMTLSDEAVLDLVRRDLKTVLDWNGESQAVHIGRWSRAIPRYGLDHAALGEALRKAEAQTPGLRFFGNFHGGVSLSDRIEKAASLAKEFVTSTSPRDRATA